MANQAPYSTGSLQEIQHPGSRVAAFRGSYVQRVLCSDCPMHVENVQ